MIRAITTVLALLWTAPVVTEKVDVRDRGAIDLAPFACTDTPRSTIIQSVCYDQTSRYLLIGIKGAYRDYCAVPPATYEAFIIAPSMGHFYRQNLAASDVDGPFKCRTDRAQTSRNVPMQ